MGVGVLPPPFLPSSTWLEAPARLASALQRPRRRLGKGRRRRGRWRGHPTSAATSHGEGEEVSGGGGERLAQKPRRHRQASPGHPFRPRSGLQSRGESPEASQGGRSPAGAPGLPTSGWPGGRGGGGGGGEERGALAAAAAAPVRPGFGGAAGALAPVPKAPASDLRGSGQAPAGHLRIPGAGETHGRLPLRSGSFRGVGLGRHSCLRMQLQHLRQEAKPPFHCPGLAFQAAEGCRQPRHLHLQYPLCQAHLLQDLWGPELLHPALQPGRLRNSTPLLGRRHCDQCHGGGDQRPGVGEGREGSPNHQGHVETVTWPILDIRRTWRGRLLPSNPPPPPPQALPFVSGRFSQ